MKAPRFLTAALLTSALVVVSSSCGDRTPLGLGAGPQAELLGTLTKTVSDLTLLKCTPMPDAEASATIGPAGGVIQVGPHTLSIPAGALSDWVTITAEAPSDTVNYVHFEPQGLQFSKKATLTMSYANCGLLSSLTPKEIVYTTDDLLTILDVLQSVDDPLNAKVTAKLKHFSEYAMAW